MGERLDINTGEAEYTPHKNSQTTEIHGVIMLWIYLFEIRDAMIFDRKADMLL